ncbi:L-threonylcarbamoyladenylate synthase [soil metagenome]
MVYRIDCGNLDDLEKCSELIDKGGIVVYPTDTVFGIGCDPTIEKSVLRLFAIKERPLEKSLPILTSDWSIVSRIAHITPQAKILHDLFWPGKLTLILKLKPNHGLSKYVFNNDNNTIGLRIPGCPCILNLISNTRSKLLVGTSANLSKKIPSTRLADIDETILNKCDAVIFNEILSGSYSGSTIVDVSGSGSPSIVREGAIPKEKILAALKP